MNKTTLYIIRHGKTEGSQDRRYKGHIDVPLSEEGLRQVQDLADALFRSGVSPSRIYSSDLKRAVQTAEAIDNALSCGITIEPRLRERSFGVWEGMTFEEISKAWPEAFENWKADPLRFHPPEGESTLEVRDRVMEATEEILQKHRGEEVLIVAHGGVNRVLICEFLGLDLRHIFRIEQDFACVNIVDIYEDGLPVVKRLNYHCNNCLLKDLP
ncbi:MAG: alpha-ribazole phosphatase [Nitrospirae bacterium]|nr:MAG: alpha-ribazole phosphatase [Nitrospirota bacterium]